MKSNFFNFFLQLVIIFFINLELNAFNFETKHLQILKEENLIIAEDGKVNLDKDNFEIEAKKFIYRKDVGILESEGEGLALIKKKKTYIYFDKSLYDEKNSILIAEGNIEIDALNENISLKTNKILFEEKKSIISSSEDTIIKDKFLNTYKVKNFRLELDTNILKLEDLEFIDKNKNIFISKIAFLNTKSGKLFAKDIELKLDNKSLNEENEFRLKGKSLVHQTDKTIIKKGVFTSCKIRDGCSPWKISANKITHDKNKKEIYYNKAFLKIYDYPVMYFPKFYHPDPTIKRKSGFLVPSFASSSNSSSYINTPYFLAISENKDMTFYPRIYTKDKILLQSEFRQVNSASKHIADFSFLGENNKKSKNHFFYKYFRDNNLTNLVNSRLDILIQKTSNDNYLKSEKLKNENFNNNNILENSINLEL
jgi:LPS-assembly protein